MSDADLPQMQKYWEKTIKEAEQYKAAVEKQSEAEPGHMEALLLKEKEFAEDDKMPINEGELVNIMELHKNNSPFALDVATARAKLFEAMKE
jgi:hypothetical protein